VVEDIGKINVGGWTLFNWDKKGNGYIDYPKVLQVSSNVGMVKIMQNLPSKTYWDWLYKLGISKNLETDLFESTHSFNFHSTRSYLIIGSFLMIFSAF